MRRAGARVTGFTAVPRWLLDVAWVLSRIGYAGTIVFTDAAVTFKSWEMLAMAAGFCWAALALGQARALDRWFAEHERVEHEKEEARRKLPSPTPTLAYGRTFGPSRARCRLYNAAGRKDRN